MFLKPGRCVIVGKVVNIAGRPAKGVLVKVRDIDKQVLTDYYGRFKVTGMELNSTVVLEFFLAHTLRYSLIVKLSRRITKLDSITLLNIPVLLASTPEEPVPVNLMNDEVARLKDSAQQSIPIDAGEGVLMLGSGEDPYDQAMARWASNSYNAVQKLPQLIVRKYTSGLQLLKDYWCIWVGVQGNITDPDIMAMMQPGGIIDEFVRLGGIFVAHGAHTNPIVAVAPGGFSFISDTTGASDDDYPIIADSNHEYITGNGYDGAMLTDSDFQEWYITCFGYIQVPEGWFLASGGTSLGSHPVPGKYNSIILSPANDNKPELVEYCYGKGYCLINMMTFDWYSLGTGECGMNDSLAQLIKYIIFIRSNFNR